jgi:hypothetical protein
MGASEIAAGDEVSERFQPPDPKRSFSEGVVRRVDGNAPERCLFVVCQSLS